MSDEQGRTGSFQGAAVGAFESRRAEEFARLIERNGGQPFVSPSLREVQVDDPREAIDFAHQLITGQVDMVLFLTGVGFRYLMEIVTKHVDRQRFLDALSDIVTIARGPKPVAAMREVGLNANIRVPEPNTWREVLATIDGQVPVGNQTIAVQYYGKVNPSLTAGLEARGARVVGVPVYRWELPEDLGPLEANLQRLVRGELDIAFFTSAHQAVNTLELARRQGIEEQVLAGLNRVVVASIGPTTTEMLRDLGIRVDFEPTHPKMGHLVSEAAAAWSSLKLRAIPGIEVSSPSLSPASQRDAAWFDSPFMKACRREPTPYTPVWLMRQAGRYMQEYRDVRAKVSFLELCYNPQLCSEVMCTAVERLGVDAAIIFSDLLPILEPMGMGLEFAKGRSSHPQSDQGSRSSRSPL
ncbi:MAG: uroporphyrinogen-III synthase [Pirellulaceae bacterium]